MRKLSPKTDASHYLMVFFLFSGLTSAAFGLLGMIDTHFGSHLVKMPEPWAPLHYNTAIGLLLAGLGWMAHLTTRTRITALIGLTLSVFGVSAIVQILIAQVLGFEHPLMEGVGIRVSLGARLSPTTALCFFCCGISLFLNEFKTKHSQTIAFFAGALTAAIGATNLLGFLTGFSAGNQWDGTTPMAGPTAISFFLLGTANQGLALLRRIEAGLPLKRWLPLQTAIGLSLFVLLLTSGVSHYESLKAEPTHLPMALMGVGMVFSVLLSFLVYFAVVSYEKAAQLEKTQQEILKAKEEALKASSLKSEFLANMSHEIRTPMNAVMGLAELLSDSRLTADQRKNVESIKFSAESLLEILNEVLDLAKIEAGKMELECVDFDLRQMLRETVKLFDGPAKKQKNVLTLNYPDITPHVFRGDPNRLRQVVSNFLSNANKFTDKGKIELAVTHSGESDRHCQIRISVSDTGLGISDNKKARIFESFSQADASMSRQFGGTGLGLSISRKLVELMQGQIGFESTEAKGSCFYFEVPLEFGHLIATPSKRAKSLSHTLRILVAEDNSISRRILVKLLSKEGHGVDAVNDGEEAIKAFENIQYDLVLMDCQMPKLDGYDATKWIRRYEEDHPSKGRTPVIALTAHAMVSDRKRCFEAGMDEYLAKPYKAEDLFHLIDEFSARALLNRRQSPAPLAKTSPRIDSESLISILSLHETNGAAFLNELCALFEKTLPKNLRMIRRQLLKQDLKQVAAIAHSLKSSSSNLGAMRLYHIAERLEKTAHTGSIKGARKHFHHLELETPKTITELKSAINKLGRNTAEKAS